jgi:hypothetical protein
VLVGGPTVAVGGSVGVGGAGGVVGSGVDVGSGADVGLACTEGVAVKVGTKVLVGVTVATGAPNRPPREGPRTIAVDAPTTQTNATARATTKIVNSLLLINEFSLPLVVYYRGIPVRMQIRYFHKRCADKLLARTTGARCVQSCRTRGRLVVVSRPGRGHGLGLIHNERIVAERRRTAPAANGAYGCMCSQR